MKIEHRKLLSELSTFGIGGPADYYIAVRSIGEMQEALSFCGKKNIAYMILGKGSNCLFDDRGFKGCVIHNKIEGISCLEPGVYYVGAGYSFSLLGIQTARNNWGGLEFASGIPASVGGAVYMNAGANGTDTSESLISVDYVDEDGVLHKMAKEKLEFRYRFSSFQHMRGAIVGATFLLTACVEAKARQSTIVAYRKKTQPYGEKSAGCVFRNPASGPAGAIIEQAGLKGASLGGAAVSSVHANFIVNRREVGATAADVLALIDLVKNGVKLATGIDLEQEVRVIPYE